mgnify:CR=1 FL=1
MKDKLTDAWESFKERGFGFASVGVGASTVTLFALIVIQGAAYVYENIKWILYTELGLAIIYTGWAIERLIKDLRR